MLRASREPPIPMLTDEDLGQIASLMAARAGICVTPAHAAMLQARLTRRLRTLQLRDFTSYIRIVQSDDGAYELSRMVATLTTNITRFFREPHHFQALRRMALPPLLDAARAGGRIRIWSAGCSRGQEPYSIAMMVADAAPDFEALDIRILATDIDPGAIEFARAGLYEDEAVSTLPDTMRTRFMLPREKGAQICPKLRKIVHFRELNLHDDWPMKGQFDVIFCRNVAIYFYPAAQARLWNRLEERMARNAWLFVGHSERVPISERRHLIQTGSTTYRLSPHSRHQRSHHAT